MFRKMKFFSTSVVSLIIALLLFAVSSKAELTGSLKVFSMRATEEKWEYSGRIVLKNEQDNIVAKGNLINVAGLPAVKAEKGASFFHTASVEPIPKETYLKEPPEDFAIVKLMKTNRWLLKDSNFVFLLEGLDRLIDPYLEIAIDKSLARASIIILYEGTFSLWGYTVTIGEEGGNVKFRHGKIIDGLNAVIKGIDEETWKFPKKQEKVQEDEKNYNKSVEHSETYSADLEKQGLGKIIFDTFYSEAAIFIVHWTPGITHSPDALRELKDALLNASSIEKGSETTVKPGQYVVALRIKVPKTQI